MAEYFLVEHDKWDEPRKIFGGKNSNALRFGDELIWTIGRGRKCKWTLPDEALPEVAALLIYSGRGLYQLFQLQPDDYELQDRAAFLKGEPIKLTSPENFEVAGYRFLKRVLFGEENESEIAAMEKADEQAEILFRHRVRIRAAYIQTWDGHMSPGNFEEYERDLAAHRAWQNGEDIYDIIRREEDAR